MSGPSRSIVRTSASSASLQAIACTHPRGTGKPAFIAWASHVALAGQFGRGPSHSRCTRVHGTSCLRVLFVDHLLCPPLGHVAAKLAGEDDIAVWTLPQWSPPRVVRRVAAQWPSLAECPAARVVVMLTELPGEAPSTLVPAMRGRTVVELAVLAGGGLRRKLWPAPERSHAVFEAVERFAAWKQAGLVDAEQWISTKPADGIVTVGRVVASGRPASSRDRDSVGPGLP